MKLGQRSIRNNIRQQLTEQSTTFLWRVAGCIALLLTVLAANGQAAILGAYDFENSDGLNSVDAAANSTAGPIVLNDELNRNIAGTIGGATAGVRADRGDTTLPQLIAGTNDMSIGFTLFNAETTSGGAARSEGDYFTLTVSADSGYSLDLTQLSFRTALSNITGLTRNWMLDYSIDGGAFVNNFANGSFTGPQTTPDNTPAWSPFTVDLSSPTFDAVSSITFRFLQFGGSSPMNHAAFYDKIQLTGDVTAIPEPGTLALCSGALLLFAGRRKFCKCHQS